MVLFFDGALHIRDSAARAHELTHIPFFSQLVHDIHRLSATPFNFACFPTPDSAMQDAGYIGTCVAALSHHMVSLARPIGKLHVVGYSRGARVFLDYLLDRGAGLSELASYTSFSGAYMLNPAKLKLPEVRRVLEGLSITLGTGRECLFFLSNHAIHSALSDLGVFHTYVVYGEHYIRSFYPHMVRAVSWELREDKPTFPYGMGYTESGESGALRGATDDR